MGCHPSHWLSYFSEGLKHQPVLKHSKFSEIITRNNHTSWQSKIVHRVTGFGRIASQMEWWTIAFSWTASTTTYIMIHHDISWYIKTYQDISRYLMVVLYAWHFLQAYGILMPSSMSLFHPAGSADLAKPCGASERLVPPMRSCTQLRACSHVCLFGRSFFMWRCRDVFQNWVLCPKNTGIAYLCKLVFAWFMVDL